MTIYLIVGQRKESYAGEYGPESLAVFDDVVVSDGPVDLEAECAKQMATGDFQNVVPIRVYVPEKEVRVRLCPSTEAIVANVGGVHPMFVSVQQAYALACSVAEQGGLASSVAFRREYSDCSEWVAKTKFPAEGKWIV